MFTFAQKRHPMMRQLIEDFPSQLDKAYSNADNTSLVFTGEQFTNLIICGLGGSGIGGKIAAQLIQDEAKVPVFICNDYTLPGFVGTKSLVIISSYSGNTEETVSAMEQAIKAKAVVASITSGGAVLLLSEQHGLNCIEIPGGQPPRSQFGYSIVSLFRLLVHYQIISNDWWEQVSGLGTFLQSVHSTVVSRATSIADAIGNKIPAIYAEVRLEGVITRWRQQINENSKMLCWHHVYPEMNHNEIVGWEGGSSDIIVLMLKSGDDHPRSAMRMNITKQLYEKKGATVVEIEDRGNNRLQRVMFFVTLGDWVSLLLAEKHGVDPVSIVSIDFLKNELSKHS